MEINQILQEFKNARGYFPKKEIALALEKKEEIVPVLRDLVKEALGNPHLFQDRTDHLFALFLLSQCEDAQTFDSLIQIAQLPYEDVQKVLSKSTISDFVRFLVSTYTGDFDSLKKNIRKQKVSQVMRVVLLDVFLGLIGAQKINRVDVIAFYKELMGDDALMNDPAFCGYLILNAKQLYPAEIIEDIERLYADNKVDEGIIQLQDVRAELSESEEEFFKKNKMILDLFKPIENIEKDMNWQDILAPEKLENQSYIPKLGRNEKCPCKSGKKYKKCCMINDSDGFLSSTIDKAKEEVAVEVILEIINRMFDKNFDLPLIHEITKCPLNILEDLHVQYKNQNA